MKTLKSKILLVFSCNLLFYIISFELLFIPTKFTYLLLGLGVLLLISNTVMRLSHIVKFQEQVSVEYKNMITKFMDSYTNILSMILVNQSINIAINILLIIGWIRLLFIEFIIPILQFLSTQVKY